uniref:Uncharacterized protein n=1 Tax=Aegilops tauschii subsp. strangulata TaxID=200361 RepID=A0A453E5T0_AEGTS
GRPVMWPSWRRRSRSTTASPTPPPSWRSTPCSSCLPWGRCGWEDQNLWG